MQKDLLRLSVLSLALCGVGCSGIAMASNQTNTTSAFKNIHYYVAAHVGGTYDFIRHRTTVLDHMGNSQLYDVTGGESSMAEFGIRAGFQTQLNDRWMLQLGPAYYGTASQNITGDYEQIMDGTPDLTFKYKMHTHRFMGEGRVYFSVMPKFDLFVGGGVGIAQIYTTGATFQLAPTAGDTVPSKPKTQALTKNNAAYSLSGGVRFPVTTHFNIDLGVKQLWMGNMMIRASSDSHSDDYRNIKTGTITPTTYWVELGLTF